MAEKGPAKGDRAKTLDYALLINKLQSASSKSFTSGTFVSFFAHDQWSWKIFQFISLLTFALFARVAKAL